MLKYKLAVEPSGQDTPKYIWVLQKPERMTEGPETGAETDKLRQITHLQMQLAQHYKAFSQPWQLEKGSTLSPIDWWRVRVWPRQTVMTVLLKQTEEKTSELGSSMTPTKVWLRPVSLLANLGYSKTDTVTEDADIDDLVDLFKGLRKDMRDQKAETARLNRVLRQEQEERMRLNSSHKLEEETARLN